MKCIMKREFGKRCPLRLRIKAQFCYWLVSWLGIPCYIFDVLAFGFWTCDLQHRLAERIYHRTCQALWDSQAAEREQDIYMATIADTDLIDPLKDALNQGAMEDTDE